MCMGVSVGISASVLCDVLTEGLTSAIISVSGATATTVMSFLTSPRGSTTILPATSRYRSYAAAAAADMLKLVRAQAAADFLRVDGSDSSVFLAKLVGFCWVQLFLVFPSS